MKTKNNLKTIKIPEESSTLAELVGIILGDGNIQEFTIKGAGVATYSIRIAGNSITDRHYLETYVMGLFIKLFHEKPIFYYPNNSKKVMYLYICGKNYINFFKSKGLKPGNKIKNQSTIPDWIKRNDKYLKACIRGLIDTDGSIYLSGKWVQICFKSLNLTLLSDFRCGLMNLGFYVSKITWNKVYLSRKADIHKYYKQTGFSNTKHSEKYLKFYSPVV